MHFLPQTSAKNCVTEYRCKDKNSMIPQIPYSGKLYSGEQ